jgi:hypothetical protein
VYFSSPDGFNWMPSGGDYISTQFGCALSVDSAVLELDYVTSRRLTVFQTTNSTQWILSSTDDAPRGSVLASGAIDTGLLQTPTLLVGPQPMLFGTLPEERKATSWAGVTSLPRQVTFDSYTAIRFPLATVVETLRISEPLSFSLELDDGGMEVLDAVDEFGSSMELRVTATLPSRGIVLRILASNDGAEYTLITVRSSDACALTVDQAIDELHGRTGARAHRHAGRRLR